LDQGSGPECRVGTSTTILLGTLIPGPSVVGNEANRYIRRPIDQGSVA
jgi:hypothetical protein